VNAHTIPSTFDAEIRAAAEKFLPEWDWRWLLAELWEESHLDPRAVSPVGAQGIAQIMPGTWSEISKALRFPADATPFDPGYAIPGAAHYLARLRRAWWAPRSEDDRRRLAQASYNCGLGNMLKAQRKAKNAVGYDAIIAFLPAVTKKRALETIEYVRRIDATFQRLKCSTS
jgi:membrane-bound lytic murein transglycosylase F